MDASFLIKWWAQFEQKISPEQLRRWLWRFIGVCILIELIWIGADYLSIRKLDRAVATATAKPAQESLTPVDPKKNDKPKPKIEPLTPKRNIFTKVTQVQYNLSAILGDQAVINDKLLRVGEKIGSATVEEIGIEMVKIKDAETGIRELRLFQSVKMIEPKKK